MEFGSAAVLQEENKHPAQPERSWALRELCPTASVSIPNRLDVK